MEEFEGGAESVRKEFGLIPILFGSIIACEEG